MPPAGSIPGRADTCTTPSMYRVGVPNRLAVHRCVELFVGVHDAGGRVSVRPGAAADTAMPSAPRVTARVRMTPAAPLLAT